MINREHWDGIYASRSAREVGWYAPHLEISLRWIEALNLARNDPVIDVGGGASTLVDDLLEAGHADITVVDLSGVALEATRDRLGEHAGRVSWLEGDVTALELPCGRYRLWHDRAVFHFLIEAQARDCYRQALLNALAPGGYFVIGAFAPDAPPRCSGLPVRRYDSDLLTSTFGAEFELKRQTGEVHVTPSGVEQAYVYCLFQRSV
jgi:SAM-dependent methyltransferase